MHNKVVSQILIQWHQEDVLEAIWEDYYPFVVKNPNFNFED